ncbi:MAG: hypothetical protein EOP02_36940 [Proteobacteria bacterium]|nr:MAG: hypothetical protein EOP02_36940 [Pseudomonadota bacterium]
MRTQAAFTVQGKIDLTAPGAQAAFDALFAPNQEHEEREMARIQQTALMTGCEVVYDLSMFDLDWSPVFIAGPKEPIAWLHRLTGERRPGAAYPEPTTTS